MVANRFVDSNKSYRKFEMVLWESHITSALSELLRVTEPRKPRNRELRKKRRPDYTVDIRPVMDIGYKRERDERKMVDLKMLVTQSHITSVFKPWFKHPKRLILIEGYKFHENCD